MSVNGLEIVLKKIRAKITKFGFNVVWLWKLFRQLTKFFFEDENEEFFFVIVFWLTVYVLLFQKRKKDEKTIDKMPFVNYSEAATSVFGASPPFGAAASCLLASAAAGSAVVSLAAPSSALSLASPASLAVSPVFSLVDSFFLSFFSFFSFLFEMEMVLFSGYIRVF